MIINGHVQDPDGWNTRCHAARHHRVVLRILTVACLEADHAQDAVPIVGQVSRVRVQGAAVRLLAEPLGRAALVAVVGRAVPCTRRHVCTSAPRFHGEHATNATARC